MIRRRHKKKTHTQNAHVGPMFLLLYIKTKTQQRASRLYSAQCTCAAPTMTAAIRGVVPKKERIGAKVCSNRISEKKPAPVSANTVGVTRAAVVQPNFWKM